jgi:hypothetical protein
MKLGLTRFALSLKNTAYVDSQNLRLEGLLPYFKNTLAFRLI